MLEKWHFLFSYLFRVIWHGYVDARRTITCKGTISENIGEGCAPEARAAEAMWSELKRYYVSSEDLRTFDLTTEIYIPSANVKNVL